MTPVQKLYIKIFLYTGVAFGLISTVIDPLILGEPFVLWKFLFKSVFFGLFMSLALVSWHLRELKKMGVKNMSDENLAIRQKKTIKTHFSKDEIVNKLKSTPNLDNRSLKESTNSIMIKTKMSWKSWGERISISFNEVEDGIQEITISSKPKAIFAFIDYGKNKKNVLQIEELLTNAL